MPSLYQVIGASAIALSWLSLESNAQPRPGIALPVRDHECGAPALYFNKDPIVIKTIFFGLCGPANVLNVFENPDTATRLTMVKEGVEKLKEKNGWNSNEDIVPIFEFAFPDIAGEACVLPSDIFGDEVVVRPPKSKVITFNYIFSPSVITNLIDATAVKFATQIEQSLVKNLAVSTFTTCIGDNNNLCNAISVKLVTQNKYGFSTNANTIGDDIASSLGCSPRFPGAIPRYSDNSEGGDSTCACVCPTGQTFDDGNSNEKTCVAVPDKLGNQECKKECIVKTTDELSLGTGDCEISGIGKDMIIPSPWDNYVFNQENTAPAEIYAKWVNVDDASNTKSEIFEWKKFNTSAADWKSFLTFTQVGRYKITVTAKDYSKSADCETYLVINDNFSPSGDTGTCTPSIYQPTADDDQTAPAYGSDLVNLKSAIKSLKNVKDFLMNVDKGNCGKGDECNLYRTSTRNLNDERMDNNGTEFPSITDKYFELNVGDHEALTKIKDTILNDVPGKPTMKCRGVAILLGEERIDYTCPAADAAGGQIFPSLAGSSCIRPNDWTSSETGRSCETYECFKVDGKDFYEAKIETSEGCKKETLNATQSIGNTATVNPESSIVRIVPGKTVGDGPDGILTLDLTKSIDFSLGFTDLANDEYLNYNGVAFSGTTINDFIKCRYKVNGGTPVTYKAWDFAEDAENFAEFSQPESKIVIECYTTIGLIARQEINVVVYPTSNFDISAPFSKIAWTQGGSTDMPFKSYPNSDFADLTFTLQKDFDAGLTGEYRFQEITCTARYVSVFADGMTQKNVSHSCLILEYKGELKDITKHYSFDLIKDPTTEAITSVNLKCTIVYKHPGQNLLSAQVVNTKVQLEDQEQPKFPESKIFDCAKEAKCNNQIKPFGYCGSNFLTYSAASEEEGGSLALGKIEFREGLPGKECCQDCGDFVCENIYDGDETLKQCACQGTVTSSADTVASLMEHHEDTVGHGYVNSAKLFSLSGAMMISVFAAIGIVVGKFIISKKKNNTDNSGYTPLL